MEIDIRKRKIGLNFTDNGFAEVWLWAPKASSVGLHIVNTNNLLQMLKQDFGYWFLKTNQIKPGDEYAFVLSGNPSEKNAEAIITRADPASTSQPEGIKPSSAAFDLGSFHWTDGNWNGIPLHEYIIYELHTGTFSAEGSFDAVVEKLDYLVDLGITAIEIMPLSQFPGSRNWGYDGVFPFAVQNSYGGPEALQNLVNHCHQKGLAVILDVVYNHFGPEGNYFSDFGPYFTEKHHTPWGAAINFDDDNAEGVRTFFIENALMWFRDFHIDALRLDAVHAIKDYSAQHILPEIKLYTEQLSSVTGRNYHHIVELDLNDNKFINPQQKGGYGMDAQWIDEFHHALRVAAGQKKTGYYSDFSGVADLAKSYNDAYVYDGQYSSHRKKNFGVKTDNPGEQFIVFSQNHDQIGNRMLGERSSVLVSFELLKLMAGAVFCSPFIPMIFMGEEWAETNPFQFFISHSNEELVEAVRNGRKAEFAAFHAEGNPPDPQSEQTFNRSKVDWTKPFSGKHKTMLNFYKRLIQIRKSSSALNALDRTNAKAIALTDKNTILLRRESNNQKLICILNFSQTEQTIQVEDLTNNWFLLLDSGATEYGGSNQINPKISANNEIRIAAESLVIFSK
ncbi:MAG: malto-oligosyltrehalose trehalohydrolase [Sphingobacteriales bacterium]|nr:MAG: malto-oligosyltrehalose trehalohydrolase [Sphingobacteriales bacterium]